MSAFKFLLFSILPILGLAYCLWKTQVDWQLEGFGLKVLWGAAASISAFISIAFLLTAKALSDLP